MVYMSAFCLAGIDPLAEGKGAVNELGAIPLRSLEWSIAELAAIDACRTTLAVS